MPEYGFVEKYTVLARMAFFYGLITPGVEKKVPKYKVTSLICKCYCGFIIWLYSMYAIDCCIGLVLHMRQGHQSSFLREVTHVIYVVPVFHRFYLLKCSDKLYGDIINSFEVFSRRLTVNAEKVTLEKMSSKVNTISISLICVTAGQNLFFTGLNIYRFGVFSGGTSYTFLNNWQTTLYTSSLSFTVSILAGVYFFLMASVLESCSTQLSILQMRLGNIFSTLGDDDRECLPECTGQCIHRAVDKRLGEWVQLHVKTIRAFNDMNKMFRTSVFYTYGGVTLLMTTLISTSLKGKYPLSLIGYSLISLGSLFGLAYYGNKATDQSEYVTFDVLDKPYFLYSKKMQKSLLIILRMSLQPKQITFFGILPLSMVTFYSVLKITYSLLSLLSAKVATGSE